MKANISTGSFHAMKKTYNLSSTKLPIVITMPTCPDCGNIIMEGDPYCEHCGAHLSWSDERESQPEENRYSEAGLDDIIDSMRISAIQKMALKEKLETILTARDCVRLEAREGRGEYIFTVTRQNEYVKTVDEFFFDPREQNMTRVFCECLSNHTHDGLLKSTEFKNLIKKTGLDFIECRGGYRTRYISILEGFEMLDEIDILVYFRMSENKERVYHLDLERMELKNPHEYEI